MNITGSFHTHTQKNPGILKLFCFEIFSTGKLWCVGFCWRTCAGDRFPIASSRSTESWLRNALWSFNTWTPVKWALSVFNFSGPSLNLMRCYSFLLFFFLFSLSYLHSQSCTWPRTGTKTTSCLLIIPSNLLPSAVHPNFKIVLLFFCFVPDSSCPCIFTLPCLRLLSCFYGISALPLDTAALSPHSHMLFSAPWRDRACTVHVMLYYSKSVQVFLIPLSVVT